MTGVQTCALPISLIITGMLVAGLALLAIAVYYFILLKIEIDDREIVNALIALGFGASLISIFARLGGGIFK